MNIRRSTVVKKLRLCSCHERHKKPSEKKDLEWFVLFDILRHIRKKTNEKQSFVGSEMFGMTNLCLAGVVGRVVSVADELPACFAQEIDHARVFSGTVRAVHDDDVENFNLIFFRCIDKVSS